MVIILALQDMVGVGVAARPNDVMNTGTIFIPAIPLQSVVANGGHRPGNARDFGFFAGFVTGLRLKMSVLSSS